MRKKIMTILIAFVMIFSVAAPSALNPSGTTTVSVAKKKMTKKQVKKAYKKLKKGMTKKQVKKILGKLGQKIQDSFDDQEYSQSLSIQIEIARTTQSPIFFPFGFGFE